MTNTEPRINYRKSPARRSLRPDERIVLNGPRAGTIERAPTISYVKKGR